MAAGAFDPGAPPPALDPEGTRFYEQLAVVAALEGVCVDLYAVSAAPCGLACVAPLCEKTGGVLHYYAAADDAALPQVRWRRCENHSP